MRKDKQLKLQQNCHIVCIKKEKEYFSTSIYPITKTLSFDEYNYNRVSLLLTELVHKEINLNWPWRWITIIYAFYGAIYAIFMGFWLFSHYSKPRILNFNMVFSFLAPDNCWMSNDMCFQLFYFEEIYIFRFDCNAQQKNANYFWHERNKINPHDDVFFFFLEYGLCFVWTTVEHTLDGFGDILEWSEIDI